MKFLFDIGHPAHVHYFRQTINILAEHGHKSCIVARDKDVTLQLLDSMGFSYINREKGGDTSLSKSIYHIKGDYILIKALRQFRPDVTISCGSPYLAHASSLCSVPHIVLTDTEKAKTLLNYIKPFTSVFLTPYCFHLDLGRKHIKYKSFIELSHLSPVYFKPDPDILRLLGVNESSKFIILRFVSWHAYHDLGEHGLNINFKRNLINELSRRYTVFISSEGPVPGDLAQYQLKLDANKFHQVLKFASLYLGEGATSASEAVMLGTPAIYVNPIDAGTIQMQAAYGLLFNFRDGNGVLKKAIEIMENLDRMAQYFKSNHERLLNEHLNTSLFLTWFLENYPKSKEIMKADPGYQLRFLSTNVDDR